MVGGTQISIPATQTDLDKARGARRLAIAAERQAEETWKASAAIARRDREALKQATKARRDAEDVEEGLVAILNREA